MNLNEQPNTTELFRLDGQVAIITGAAGLLGVQHAIALSDFGASIVLTDLHIESCAQTAVRILERTQVQVVTWRCDVTQRSSWQALLGRVISHFGHIDILVNNAAFTTSSPSAKYDASFHDFPLEDW